MQKRWMIASQMDGADAINAAIIHVQYMNIIHKPMHILFKLYLYNIKTATYEYTSLARAYMQRQRRPDPPVRVLAHAVSR